DPERRERLVTAAHERGLEVLLEVHGDEAPRVLTSKADLIGVNARDLDTLQVNPEGALAAIEQLRDAGRQVVALSGIQDRHGVRRAQQAGATACLVGTHLMRHPDRALALRALRHPVAKVCGITDDTGLNAAIQAGADLVGFIVGAPNSPRSIGSLQAQQLADRARASGLSTVLVTPHLDDWEVREWCRVVRPDWLQLHGLRPDPEWVYSLKAVGTHVIQAIGPGDDLEEAEGWVFDAAQPGSGSPHDWDAVAARKPGGFTLIAGGIDADNAAAALAATGTWGADASSRLESTPGRKDPERVAAFVRAVQEAP
ncbi:MAG: bifunctional indole-3-glycerol phosphate synthase/phosphoribosylanthranilate isomerase, partial [Thermoplasmatota archaeon]